LKAMDVFNAVRNLIRRCSYCSLVRIEGHAGLLFLINKLEV
jgi:hypothetical protein